MFCSSVEAASEDFSLLSGKVWNTLRSYVVTKSGKERYVSSVHSFIFSFAFFIVYIPQVHLRKILNCRLLVDYKYEKSFLFEPVQNMPVESFLFMSIILCFFLESVEYSRPFNFLVLHY